MKSFISTHKSAILSLFFLGMFFVPYTAYATHAQDFWCGNHISDSQPRPRIIHPVPTSPPAIETCEWRRDDERCTDNPVCWDSLDNDGDGLTDFGNDLGCATWYDTNEFDPVISSSPTADVKANGSDGPIMIPSNTSARISWNSSGASSCTVLPGGWTGVSSTGILTGPLTSSRTYTLSCTGPQGLYGRATENKSCGPYRVCTNLYNPSEPIYPAACSPGPVNMIPSSVACATGMTRVLIETELLTQNCEEGGLYGDSPRLEHFSCSGTPIVSDTVTINVGGMPPVPPPAPVAVRIPTVSITATPDRVPWRGQTRVKWDATNVNACTITRNGVVWRSNLTGASLISSATDTITGQTTYVISCTPVSGGSVVAATATKVVNVLTDFQEF